MGHLLHLFLKHLRLGVPPLAMTKEHQVILTLLMSLQALEPTSVRGLVPDDVRTPDVVGNGCRATPP
jgi:hypothetical protein